MKIEFKKRIFYYFSIFTFLFLQYGLVNITKLGFVTDDWAVVKHISEGIEPSFYNLLNFRAFSLNPGFSLSRPLGVLTGSFHVWLSGSNPVSHHLWKMALLTVAMFLLYEFLKILTNSPEISLFSVLVFISLPFHTSSYYWLCTRISIYALIFALLSAICVLKNNKFLVYFAGPMFLFMSFSSYELFVGFIPVFAYIFYFTEPFKKRPFFKKTIILALYSLAVVAVFVYRKFILINYFGYILPKEVSVPKGIFSVGRLQSMLSNIFGVGMFDFIKSSVSLFPLIRSLIYLPLLIFVLFFIIAFITHNSLFVFPISSRMGTSRLFLHLGIIVITFGLFSLLFTNYNYSLGSVSDRVNIFVDIGISLLIMYLYLKIPIKYAKYFIIFILFFFTLINWVYLATYINSYDYQRAFIKYVKSADIPNNSIIFLDTDIKVANGVPILDTIWGLSAILAYASNNNRVEYAGDWDSYKGEYFYQNYESKRYDNYFYRNPNIIHLKFLKSDVDL